MASQEAGGMRGSEVSGEGEGRQGEQVSGRRQGTGLLDVLVVWRLALGG